MKNDSSTKERVFTATEKLSLDNEAAMMVYQYRRQFGAVNSPEDIAIWWARDCCRRPKTDHLTA